MTTNPYDPPKYKRPTRIYTSPDTPKKLPKRKSLKKQQLLFPNKKGHQ